MRYSYEKNCTKEFFETGRRKCFYPNFAVTSYRIGMLGDEKPYATFGTGRHFVTRPATAGMTGSVKIGDFKLSSDINKVIVKSSSLQAYNLTKATWQSSIEFSGMVWVK